MMHWSYLKNPHVGIFKSSAGIGVILVFSDRCIHLQSLYLNNIGHYNLFDTMKSSMEISGMVDDTWLEWKRIVL